MQIFIAKPHFQSLHEKSNGICIAMYAMHVCRKEARKAKRKERRKTVPFFRHFDKLVVDQWLGREGAGVGHGSPI